MLSRSLVVALAALATPALAADPAPPPPPKPAPALVEAFKDMSGTWVCTGSMANPITPGTELPTKGQITIRPEVGGFAYSGAYTMQKNAAFPTGSKASMHWGYDTVKKTLIEFGFDDWGNAWQGTSDGLKSGVIVWSDTGSMMGEASKSRTTLTVKSPKEMRLITEFEDKGTWKKMGEDVCKKK